MQDIDFLPSRYHERNRQRQAVTTWITVIAAIVLLLFVGGVYQHRREGALRQQLADTLERQADCQRLNTTLNTMQAELREYEALASLYEYLEHPWPRSRIIEAVLGPLPEDVYLSELSILRQQATASGSTPQRDTKRGRTTSATTEPELAPPVEDLKKLREQFDGTTEYVSLKGLALETTRLHSYLAELHASELFHRVNLEAVSALSADEAQRLGIVGGHAGQFEIRLELRPGYGQPGGPATEKTPALVEVSETRRHR